MRILHVPHTYAPNIGGTEYLCGRLSERFVELGHQVEVLVADTPYHAAYSHFNSAALKPIQSSINGVKVHRIPFCDTWQYRVGGKFVEIVERTKWKRLYWFLTYRLTELLGRTVSTSFLAQQIKLFQPDIVMSMAHLFPPTHWVLKVRHTLPFPLVHIPLVHYNQYDQIAQSRHLYQQADSTITLTQTEANALIQECGLEPASIVVGSIGTEIPEALPPKSETPYVLSFSRKEPYKGIEETIAAMREVWQTVPHLQLILAGPRTGNSAFLDTLLGSLSNTERSNIIEVGKVTQEERKSLLRHALCLLFPSQSESFGLVLIEAMAHETVPITWDIPLFREIVKHGETGLLAEVNNRQSLAAAILSLIEKPTMALRIGQNGRRHVEATHRWESVAQRYLQAYEYARHQNL